MLKGINWIIKETKINGYKPKYLVCNYITKSLIPFKKNIKGQEIYKGLIIQTYSYVPNDIIYLHRFKPKLC